MIQSIYDQLKYEKLPPPIVAQLVKTLLDTVSTLRAYLIKAPQGKQPQIILLIAMYESLAEEKKSEMEVTL